MSVVTAVDASGNESTPSTGAYLNFGLLPVGSLQLALADGGLPILTWQHNGIAISGYDIYQVGSEISQLNSGRLTGQSFAHDAYNGGNPVSGAPLPITYRVIAVDDNNVESLGTRHTLTRPVRDPGRRPAT